MAKIFQVKLNWHYALGGLAMGISAIALLEFPATANTIADRWQLAQVGVYNSVTPPTSLNLRPRVHIPLPTQSSDDFYGDYPRDHRSYDDGDCQEHHHRRHGYKRNRRDRGKVIIIKPGNVYDYGNYHRSIRVINH